MVATAIEPNPKNNKLLSEAPNFWDNAFLIQRLSLEPNHERTSLASGLFSCSRESVICISLPFVKTLHPTSALPSLLSPEPLGAFSSSCGLFTCCRDDDLVLTHTIGQWDSESRRGLYQRCCPRIPERLLLPSQVGNWGFFFLPFSFSFFPLSCPLLFPPLLLSSFLGFVFARTKEKPTDADLDAVRVRPFTIREAAQL